MLRMQYVLGWQELDIEDGHCLYSLKNVQKYDSVIL